MENEEMRRTAMEIGLVKMLPTTRRVIYCCVCSFECEVPSVPQTWVLGLPKVPGNNCICFLPTNLSIMPKLQFHRAFEPQTDVAEIWQMYRVAPFCQYLHIQEQQMWSKWIKRRRRSCFVAMPSDDSSTKCCCSERAVTTDDATNTLVKLIITK